MCVYGNTLNGLYRTAENRDIEYLILETEIDGNPTVWTGKAVQGMDTESFSD